MLEGGAGRRPRVAPPRTVGLLQRDATLWGWIGIVIGIGMVIWAYADNDESRLIAGLTFIVIGAGTLTPRQNPPH